jgi:hypothetical protein
MPMIVGDFQRSADYTRLDLFRAFAYNTPGRIPAMASFAFGLFDLLKLRELA